MPERDTPRPPGRPRTAPTTVRGVRLPLTAFDQLCQQTKAERASLSETARRILTERLKRP